MLQAKALQIAEKAHTGQFDKGGKPYIQHPLAVAALVDTEDEKIVALLHDVVEDSAITLEDLSAAGFPVLIVEAVKAITKTPGLDYWEYLDSVKANPIARRVKMADLRHNMDLSRLSTVTDKEMQRMEKYQKALRFLIEEKL